MRTGTASGLQIAFLIFAVALLAVPLSSYLNAELGISKAAGDLLGRTLPFFLAAVIVAIVPGLRRQIAEELSRPIPPGRRIEVAAVAVAKVSLLLGAFGGIALWTWMSEGPAALAQKMAYTQNDELANAFSGENLFLLLVLGAMIAPVIEEIVFRGFLYRAWEKRWGWVPSALLVSLFFGLYHPLFFNAFISSLLFIAVLRRVGSIWGPIAVHGFSNAMAWYPFAGQLAKPGPTAALGDIGSWGFQLGCLLFVAAAFPLYLLLAAREDVRDGDNG
jgi:membrane protease YdiL (CAAX protease family)